jgi:hypothetical protein
MNDLYKIIKVLLDKYLMNNFIHAAHRYKCYLQVTAIILLIMLSSQKLISQKTSSFEGQHFFVSFMQNETRILYPGVGIELQIFIATNDPAVVNVNIPTISNTNYNINKDGILTLDMKAISELRQSETILRKGIEISSDVPVSVYVFSSQDRTSDLYAAIPVPFWGTEYVAVSFPNDQYIQPYYNEIDSLQNFEPRQSEFEIMAAYDSTSIDIIPAAITELGKQVGRTYSIMLNKGECYLVKSYKASIGLGDLSGSIVRGNKPFGFLSGHVRTAIPNTLGNPMNSKNHLVEMLSPTSSWGKRYVSVPFGTNKKGDFFKVLNIKPNTTVTLTTNSMQKIVTLTDPGSFATFSKINEPAVWQSDEPVEISQSMMHTEDEFIPILYDPCLVMLPPAEQYVNKILFQTPGNSLNNPKQFDSNFVSVVAEESALSDIQLDGILLNSFTRISSQKIVSTNLYWTNIKLKSGKHEISSVNGKFSGIVFAMGDADSYATALGTSLNNVLYPDTLPPEFSLLEDCGRLQGTIHDDADTNSTGFSVVTVNADSTFNYKYTITGMSDTSKVVEFQAEPINYFADGRIIVYAIDKNGNMSRFEYDYKGKFIDATGNIDFTGLNITDTICVDAYIINLSEEDLVLDDILSNDVRVVPKEDFSFPATMNPGGRLDFKVCYYPDGDSTKISGLLTYRFHCMDSAIAVRGSIEAPGILAIGHDFGDVLVGDTICSYIYLVNTGNVPLDADSLLIMNYLSEYKFDTTGIFPRKMYPGDTLRIRVCYMPMARQRDSLGFTCLNNKNLPNNASVTGNGVAPLFESIVIDWKGRRLQTKNDTTAYIVNKGNSKGKISFIGKIFDTGIFDDSFIPLLDTELLPGDTLRLPVWFFPMDTIQYHSSVICNVDWHLHPALNIDLYGWGTLPVIDTVDVDFDTVKVNTSRDSIITMIFSTGNEALTIDSIVPIAGDSASFIIDYNKLKNLKLPIYTSYSIPITFHPDTIGTHILRLEITDDAAPSYARKKDYLTLTGYAIRLDTLDAVINAQMPPVILSCKQSLIDITLKNTGNVPLNLQKLELFPENIDAAFEPAPFLPDLLDTLGIKYYRVRVYPHNSNPAKINIVATLNDTLIRNLVLDIYPTPLTIDISPLFNFEKQPGDTAMIQINGSFPVAAEDSVDFSVRLDMEKRSFYVGDNKIYLVLTEQSRSKKYLLDVYQDDHYLLLSTKGKDLLLKDGTDWSVTIPVTVMLYENREPEVHVTVSANDCYKNDSLQFNPRISDVCSFNLRLVDIMGKIPTVSINPNPASENITINVDLPADDNISVNFYDKIGKKLIQSSNYYLKKGTSSLIFEITTLPNDVYLVSINTSYGTINRLFVIYK